MLFRSVFFNLHIIWDFLVLFQLLLSSLIILWYERFMISFLNLLCCVLLSCIWSVLVNVPWDHGRKKYILLLLDEVLYRWLVLFSWLMVLLSSVMALLIFCLLAMSISHTGVVRSPTIIQIHQLLIWLSLVFTSNILRPINIKDCYVILECWPLLSLCNVLLSLW